ncbi:pyocin knob domain-containing protein [Candidatus Chlamydia sanziniae]|uniref:Uncharacterized protein n=1 Tax=Candidatus Chlamydia sanziniae TaxID=1806891 RepID=A0A1A9HUH4_9CHLA|nr:pyocin knob domain-containing protein [Candidatus Chlamydia sanziniae]ANH78639.1 hypothetical protein Cs308_0468 [Candidatus Chlamydia sanziniae]
MNHDPLDSDADKYYSLEDLLSNSKEAHSLDEYQETGIYVEENKEHGDLLIVLSESILKGITRQFYISDDNYAYTRHHVEGRWSFWSHISIKTISQEIYDFNDLQETGFLTTTDVTTLIHAPENFSKGSESLNNIIICIGSHQVNHYVQFLIADNRRTFWIRHCNNHIWSDWTAFI